MKASTRRETNPAVLKPIVDKYNLKDVDPNKDNGSVLITAAYDYVLQTTYNQFDILLQRDSFLTTTLSTFIYADYVHKTRNKNWTWINTLTTSLFLRDKIY